MSIEAPDRLNGHTPDTYPMRIPFRDGLGGDMTPDWAAYMLHQWWAAVDRKLTFAEAVKATAVHFMVGEQS